MAGNSGSGARPQAKRALVLASYDSKDDKIVHLLFEDIGRVVAVARGGRKSLRRFGAHIQPLTLSEVVARVRPDWNLARLDRASTIESFGVMKADLLRMALGLTMAEVVLLLLPEHDHDPNLYNLLLRAWTHLNNAGVVVGEDLLLLFEVKALRFSGFLPELSEFTALPVDAREVMAGWLSGAWSPLTPTLRRQAAKVLEGTLSEQAGRGLLSRPFLDEALSLAGTTT